MLESSRRKKTRRAIIAVASIAWGLGIVGGSWALWVHADEPGAVRPATARWPRESAIPVATGSTLVLFAHPRCPCTRATLGELAVLLTNARGPVAAHVFFFEPESGDEAGGALWAHGALWDRASRLPGVTVHADRGGREARLFGAATSGDTFLFDSSGALAFRGGITGSRGHEGDNPGRLAIERLVAGERADVTTTPVFGCSLGVR